MPQHQLKIIFLFLSEVSFDVLSCSFSRAREKGRGKKVGAFLFLISFINYFCQKFEVTVVQVELSLPVKSSIQNLTNSSERVNVQQDGK